MSSGLSPPRPPAPTFPPEAPVPPGMKACPISATNALFGKKWTFAVLRDVAYFRRTRFAEFLSANPGLTDRVLARRLNELVAERILQRSGRGKAVRYAFTERGKDTLPILAALYNYGIRHRPEQVFKDARARPLRQVLPEWDGAFLERIFRLDTPPDGDGAGGPGDRPGAHAAIPMPAEAGP